MVLLTFLFSLVIIDDIINMTLYMNRGETMDIGQRIRFVRLFRGMKQEELAEKIGLGGGENGRTRISQYENGKREIPINILVQICKYFKVSSDYILGLTDKKE